MNCPFCKWHSNINLNYEDFDCRNLKCSYKVITLGGSRNKLSIYVNGTINNVNFVFSQYYTYSDKITLTIYNFKSSSASSLEDYHFQEFEKDNIHTLPKAIEKFINLLIFQ